MTVNMHTTTVSRHVKHRYATGWRRRARLGVRHGVLVVDADVEGVGVEGVHAGREQDADEGAHQLRRHQRPRRCQGVVPRPEVLRRRGLNL